MTTIEIAYDPNEIAPAEMEYKLSKVDKENIEFALEIIEKNEKILSLKFKLEGEYQIEGNDFWKFDNPQIEVCSNMSVVLNFTTKNTGYPIQTSEIDLDG